MPLFASSTPTADLKRSHNEAAHPWAPFDPVRCGQEVGWGFSGPHRNSLISVASGETVFGTSIRHTGATSHESRSFSGRLFCTVRALWKLNWFLTDFGYDTELLNREQVDEKALLNLRGVVRTSHTALNGRSYQNLDSFAPAGEWEALSIAAATTDLGEGDADGL
jgi:hypothetical protein